MTGKFTFAKPGLTAPEMLRGLCFSLPFLGVLTVHEFGHYFVARRNRIRVTLPYYIPFFLGIINSIGTFGAVIRIKEKIFARREFFDVGIAGPLAGFLVAVPLLIYGFLNLPPAELAIYSSHEAHQGLTLSRPLLYQFLEYWLADPARIPHPNELMHYPLLLAGLLSLFFTALNLLPIGQLDGGHILYGLLGYRRFNRVSPVLFLFFIFYAGLGLFTLNSSRQELLYGAPVYLLYLYWVLGRVLPGKRRTLMLVGGMVAAQLAVSTAFPHVQGNPGWLVFGLLLGRLTGIYHPPAPDERPLTAGRKILGWLMLAVFVLCFTPSPFR
ncbi:site-2 protease family protein [Hymenobacter busanensis]|uniref:Site-2 protease family protein n=2 Tax=Hymenobacter busanensis TaxID=2607656 RepID=A0A7L5A1F1_9BACT|nr:site-2 protease family protein [Hymenobacter busanensis]QHJ09629.1 site-2 protease family protein [Hymenobacter busanensis]